MKKFICIFLTLIFIFSSFLSVSAIQNYTIMSEAIYNMADSFYSNITKISKNSAWAICDTNGYPITSYSWEAMGTITDEYIPAKKGGQWGYISPEGKVLIPYQFQKADNFSEGLARVLTPEGVYAYINHGGVIEFVSPFDYSFSAMGGAVCGIKNGLYGYCDTTGGVFIHPQFDMGFDFHEGYAAVKFGGKWGYISTDGTYRIKPTYKHASDFKNGYAVCALSSGYGIIDTEGNKISPFSFDYIGECDYSGRFPAKSGSKCGYIDATGKWLMEVDYDFCYTFTDGVARVYNDGLWGYINENGETLVMPVFADCGEYRNGRAFFSFDGALYGFLSLDKDGSPDFSDFSSDNSTSTENNFFYIENNSNENIIDTNNISNIPSPVYEENCISLRVNSPFARKNNDVISLGVSPVLIDGMTMMPLRSIIEFMGGSVTWDSSSSFTIVSFNDTTIHLMADDKLCYVNQSPVVFSSPPILINGVTMVSARNICDIFNCELIWDDSTHNLFIKY